MTNNKIDSFNLITPNQVEGQIDIVEYIREQGVELKKYSINKLECLCPFHKNPRHNLIISPKKKLFECQNCKITGSVIDFAMKFHNLSLSQTLKNLKHNIDRKNSIKLDSINKNTSKQQLLPETCRFYMTYQKTE